MCGRSGIRRGDRGRTGRSERSQRGAIPSEIRAGGRAWVVAIPRRVRSGRVGRASRRVRREGRVRRVGRLSWRCAGGGRGMGARPGKDWVRWCGWKVGIWCGRAIRGRCVWKGCFVKNNMSRDNDLASRQIETPVAFLFTGISEEDAVGRARRKLVGNRGREVGET